jgi:hypothetical protein
MPPVTLSPTSQNERLTMTDQQSPAPSATGLETTPGLPVPAAVTTVETQDPPEPKHPRTRNGKVAGLSKAIRDDPIPYRTTSSISCEILLTQSESI